MPHLKTPSGLNWYYEISGPLNNQGKAGLTLLFLHGFGVNNRIWKQQLKYFRDSCRVIVLDLPGHGLSDWQTISLDGIAADIVFILNELRCAGIGIVASSFGGLVALKILETDPSLIQCFVFAGSQPKFCRSDDYPFGLDRAKIHKLAGQLDSDYPAMVHIFFRSLFTRHERETRRFKWIQTFRKTDYVPKKEALLVFLGLLEREDLRVTFFGLTIPILFVNGTEDYICQREFYEGIEGKMPLAQFMWLEKCGHFPFLSKPHEFNTVVESFLNNLNNSSGPVCTVNFLSSGKNLTTQSPGRRKGQ